MTDPTPVSLRLAEVACAAVWKKTPVMKSVLLPRELDQHVARALDEAGVAKAVDVLERLTMPVCSFHKRRALANDALAALRGETK